MLARFVGRVRFWGRLFSIGCLFMTLLPLAGRYFWLCEMASHLCFQILVLQIFAFVAALLTSDKSFAGINLLFALWNLTFLAPLVSLTMEKFYPGKDISLGEKFRVLAFNVYTSNRQFERTLEFVEKTKPDIALFMEIDQGWGQALLKLKERMPYHLLATRSDNFGIGLFSRLPLASEAIVVFASSPSMIPSIVANVRVGSETLHFVGTHPLPPVRLDKFHHRNAQLASIALWLKKREGGVILAGDLNMTPYSPYFRDLMEEGKLGDSRTRFGIQPTYPTPANRLGYLLYPHLAYPIDHCLYREGFLGVVHRQVGPDLGSDHYPIIVDFAFPKGK